MLLFDCSLLYLTPPGTILLFADRLESPDPDIVLFPGPEASKSQLGGLVFHRFYFCSLEVLFQSILDLVSCSLFHILLPGESNGFLFRLHLEELCFFG